MSMETQTIEQTAINTVRALAADAVQKANSGHPGTPMGLAPLGHVLWTESMNYNPHNPEWVNRDRFILSAGHACMLQYSFLYLTGYDINLDDIKNFGSAKGNFYAKPIDSSSAIKVVNTDYDVSGWQNYSGQDANSHGSPKSITDLNDLRFEYNATSSSKTINLDANYIDVKNNSYNGSVTLAPYTSVVLIKTGAKQNSLLPAVNPNNTVNGMDYRYYEGDFSGVPDFSKLTPVKKGTVTNYDLSISNRGEKFAVSFSGYINVPSDGQYTFYTSSDDGTMLYIDNNLVVNNDGEHGVVEKSGTIGLQAGKHAISLGYIQRTGDASLNVSYSGPGISKQLIPFFIVFKENWLANCSF